MSGKRANIFGQGKPERPYEERDEEAAEVPQRATAAQLATRKIKTAKVRRPAGGASTPSMSANFAAPQANSFNFGASAPAVGGNNSTNGMFGASSNAFGGGATNSFPPAQSAAPSNNFTSSSFPAFGAGSQSTGFNPQPPSANDFNFSAGGSSNMFGSGNNAPAMNGNSNGTSAFGGGSMFGSQAPPSNPFGGLAQNNTSSAAGSGGLFGTTSSTPSTNMFGTTSSAANASSTPAPAAAPFTFGAPASSSAQTAGTPAPANNLFSGFGAGQNNAAPAQNSLFSGFGANAQGGASQQETPKPSLFSTGTSAQSTGNATATAPVSNMFSGFGSNAQSGASTPSSAPASNMFGTAGTTSTAPALNMFATAGTPSSAPAGNPFASLPKATEPSTPFTFGQQTPKAQEPTPAAPSNPFSAIKLPTEAAGTPQPSLFSSVKAPEPAASAPSETPKPNLFASLAKPPPTTTASSPGFSLFGAAQNKDTDTAEKPAETATAKAPEASKPSLFSGGFSTSQPAKTAGAEKPQGMFTAQPKSTGSGMFAQTFQSETNNASNAFNKAAPAFSGFKAQATPAEASKDTASQSVAAPQASNPFSKLPTSSTNTSNLFTQAKEQAPTPAPATSSTPAFTSNGPELPKIPRTQVPTEWTAASTSVAQNTDSLYNLISSLTTQLQQLNEKYRTKLNALSPMADWAPLSHWHHQHSSAIKRKIDVAKKQRASAKGITGNETTVTKRKVNDDSPEDRNASPTKRARPAEVPATPTPQPSVSAPKLGPPATATSNLFARALNNKPSAPAEQPNMFAPKTAPTPAPEPSKGPSQVPGFTPFSGAASPASIGAGGFQFKPSTTAAPATGGFKPTVPSGGGGFAAQFAASAKSLEQLAAERKKKAMDEDYDSDDETKAEWSARYDKKEAERIAKEKEIIASAKGFSLPGSGQTSGASTPVSSAAPTKPATGTSNGLFGSRPASPASSANGSVFDAPSTAQTPSSNIFGHLSSGASSNNQDDSDDDGQQHPVGSVEPTTPPKRKSGASDVEDNEAAKRQKSDAGPKGSLLSRMSRAEDDGSESEKENNSTSLFGSNGSTTPANKPFNFFDFSAAGSKTAPPKSDTFVGDQTFKPGTPIKFGEAATEKKAAPTFQFQAPSTSTTPSKPPPTNLFNFGSTTTGSLLSAPNAGLGSTPSSTFTSRAATPLSEADNSAAEDDEEGGKQEQVDLSKLTPEELASNDVVFETEQALAKHQVDQGDGTKAWENFARGPLYILKDKVTGKCFVRIRIASGATPLNYSILPKLKTQVTGSSGKMVQAIMPKKEGGFSQYFISLKTSELATEFSQKYNDSLPL